LGDIGDERSPHGGKNMATLKERLANGEMIILDGAIGTELQRMGVPMHDQAWCAVALKDYADTVRQLHEDYIRAGADVITVNTFSSARYVLEPAGMGHMTEELNSKAVKLAMEARAKVNANRAISIAGVLSRYRLPETSTDAQLKDAYQEQADLQARAGADLILLEFLGGPLKALVSAAKAAKATGLPVWVAISGREDDRDKRVLYGPRDHPSSPRPKAPDVLFVDAMDAVMGVAGEALLVIHSEVRDTGPALKAARTRWPGSLGAYSHSGDWISPNWLFVNMISPEDYLKEAQRWVRDFRLQIVGGCCGIGVRHIELLRPGLPRTVTLA
jgi:methionine synthase I (cobalamin-dependent)